AGAVEPRAGDLGRFAPDGSVRFAGRRDFQVQIRGFRIELGEVRAAMRRHPAVGDAAVVARDGAALGLPADAGPALIAYVESRADAASAPQADDLRRFAEAQLPRYAVPSAFVVLDALPRTATRKIDRARLPQPVRAAGVAPASGSQLPRTVDEREIAAVWGDLLGQKTVDVEADFFALGGHSLLATRLLVALHERLGTAVPLRAFFDDPTVAGLARAVAQARRGAALPMPVRQPGDGPFALSPAQARLWFLQQLDPGSVAYSMPLALRVAGALDPVRLARATRAVIARHAALRTRIAVDADGTPQQFVRPDAADARGAFISVDLRGLGATTVDDACVARALRRAALRPFDLARDALLRIVHVQLARDRHALVIVQHHIVSDGWSAGLVLRDLADAYPVPLLPPPPALRAADVAAWQRMAQDAPTFADDLAHWVDRLTDTPALDLPFDRPQPARPRGRGGEVTGALPAALAQPLAALERRTGATSFAVVVAAFQALLGGLTGQRDFAVGTLAAGRHDAPGLDAVVGYLANVVALRADLTGDPDFAALVARAHTTALDAFARQHVPFDRVVNALDLPRDLDRPPVFQVLCVLHDQPRAAALTCGDARAPPLPRAT
ncbi:MAG: condensation domain-containing protein, partial [Acidobacteriota bacterium]